MAGSWPGSVTWASRPRRRSRATGPPISQAAVLDQDTAFALRRVVSAVEVARYAAPGTPVADPQPDVDAAFRHRREPQPQRAPARTPAAVCRLAAVRSLVQRVTNLPAPSATNRGDE